MLRKKIAVFIAAFALAAGGIATAATTSNASASTDTAHARLTAAGGPQLVSVNSSGSSITNVRYGKMSDDGRWVAFSTVPPDFNGTPVVYVRDLAKRVTTKMYTGRRGWDASVDLSGDDSTLGIITAPRGGGDVTEVRVVDVASGKTIAVRNDFSFLNGFSFLPTGSGRRTAAKGPPNPIRRTCGTSPRTRSPVSRRPTPTRKTR